ncbi:cytochrome P450 [Nocardia transvalensis]|uniref:Cytochrome P450 n=1 Tax=Nocardia transvalensis TaxID=37333 RepID=A0A7W9PLW5_9NOCA|nr:cytochrome P450 [Nocardia transvalensis]MBB5918432.1 cytochrome P450 [Nocardia transvalensis]
MQNNTDPIVIDPEGPDIQGEIARIRQRGPVTKVVLPGGVPAWSVTDAALLKEILSGSAVSKDPHQHWPAFRNGKVGKDFPLLNWVNTRSMFTAYGPEHRRLRNYVTPAFTNRRTLALEPRIRSIADDLVAGLDGTPEGDIVDIREHFAYPLPLRVINELMGVPEHLIGPLRKCVDGIFDIALTEEAAVANYEQMIGLLQDLVAYRRDTPGDDMTSTLIAYADDPEKDFSTEELVGTLYLTINAGHETTVDLIDQAIYLLLTHPDQLAAAVDGAVGWVDVIEEVLRFEPSIAHVPLRYAVRDFVLGEVAITAGDPILACPAGANRDPNVYGDSADEFDPTRTTKDHMAFGYGAHRCLGAPLARLEAQVALPTLFQRFPQMKFAVSPDEIGTVPGFIANGHDRLPVVLK